MRCKSWAVLGIPDGRGGGFVEGMLIMTRLNILEGAK